MSTDPARRPLRASDADREAVVEQLREAAAEGRLDMEELDERLGLALSAKTVAELPPLIEDLVPEEEVVGAGEPLVIKGGMNGQSRAGAWKVPTRIVVEGGMGGVKLDFTRTGVRHRVIDVEVNAGAGGVVVIVPEGWGVDLDSVHGGMGGAWNKTKGERLPGTPLVRVTGSGGMGGVYVRNPGRMQRRKLRRELEG
ncbi:DUF1707 domain-containing protein [Streptomyces sp. NPDC087440]|uniref:DUF1707 SHOCT-like domain-containing protein n=1 Tax=Streptomyces sp. NPDC087440 TaxID=3365790 RepID=UPI003804F483